MDRGPTNHRGTGSLLISFLSSQSRARRLEDRIRTLCHRAVEVTEPGELSRVLDQLSADIRTHVQRVRELAHRPYSSERRRT